MSLATGEPSSSKVYPCRWGNCRAFFYTYEDTINHELNHVRFDARRTEREFEEEEAMDRRLEQSSIDFINKHEQEKSTKNDTNSSPVIIGPVEIAKRAMSVSSTTSQDFIESQLTQEHGDDDEGSKSRSRSLLANVETPVTNDTSVHLQVSIKPTLPTTPAVDEVFSPVTPLHHPFEPLNGAQSWYSAPIPRKSKKALPTGERDASNKRRRTAKHTSGKPLLEMEVHVTNGANATTDETFPRHKNTALNPSS